MDARLAYNIGRNIHIHNKLFYLLRKKMIYEHIAVLWFFLTWWVSLQSTQFKHNRFTSCFHRVQPCSLMWRICQCCSLKYFLPKNLKVSFCGRMWWNISKGTWPLQFAWGIGGLFQNNEETVVFTKTKGPFCLNLKFKRWFCQCEQWKCTDIF